MGTDGGGARRPLTTPRRPPSAWPPGPGRRPSLGQICASVQGQRPSPRPPPRSPSQPPSQPQPLPEAPRRAVRPCPLPADACSWHAGALGTRPLVSSASSRAAPDRDSQTAGCSHALASNAAADAAGRRAFAIPAPVSAVVGHGPLDLGGGRVIRRGRRSQEERRG